MHPLTVNRRALLSAVDAAVPCVAPKTSPREPNKHVLLRASGDRLMVASTDGEMSLTTSIDAQCQSACETLINPQKLRAILGESSDEDAVIEVGKGSAKVVCGGKFTLQTSPSEEFPELVKFECGNHFSVAGSRFRDAMAIASACTDPSATKYALGGVFFDAANGVVAATDSRRMVVANLAIDRVGEPWEPNKNEQCVIPAKFAKILSKLDGDQIDIQLSPNSVIARAGATLLASQLMSGRFPDYERVIPASNKSKADLVAGSLASLLRRALIVTNEETCGSDFEFTKSAIISRGQASNVGSSECEIPIALDGDGMIIRCDPKLIQTFVNHLDPSASVLVRLVSSDKAVVMESGVYRYLVMPMAREE